ncbi:MAG: type VI secretion protein, partial [Pseudonocardiaceae bacterium]
MPDATSLGATGPATGHPPGVVNGWIIDYLRDPGATVAHLLAQLRAWALAWGPLASPVLVVGLAALVVARGWWRRRCHERLLTQARVVTVLVPPTVDPAGGQAVWSHLVGLLRPPLTRLLSGQPHLGCEYVFSQAGVAIRWWVPGVIPPGLVERAVEAAWPGAHTRTSAADPPLPAVGAGQRCLLVAGELRLARPEALPIRTDFDADPLRALIGAPVGLDFGEHACVQILARPVTGARVARARRAARRIHTGHSTHLIG